MSTSQSTTLPAKTGPGNGTIAKANPVNNLRDLLERQKGEIAKVLPKHLTPERMVRIALTACQRVPKLLECEPLSVVGCVMQAAELGLELTGPLGQAYMITYYNSKTKRQEAQFQIGYRGLLRLVYNSGLVSTFAAHVVYERDTFHCHYGTQPGITHKPFLGGDRGKALGAYAILLFKDGMTDFEFMPTDDLNKHRDQYAKTQVGGPWQTAWPEMARKTVMRRLAKRAPLSADIQRVAIVPEVPELHNGGEIIDHIDNDKNGMPALDIPEPSAVEVASEVASGEFPEDSIGDANED